MVCGYFGLVGCGVGHFGTWEGGSGYSRSNANRSSPRDSNGGGVSKTGAGEEYRTRSFFLRFSSFSGVFTRKVFFSICFLTSSLGVDICPPESFLATYQSYTCVRYCDSPPMVPATLPTFSTPEFIKGVSTGFATFWC